MDISKLTEQEKSVMLARARDPEEELISNEPGDRIMAITYALIGAKDEALNVYFPNLYDPDNMALAWRIAKWSATVKDTDPPGSYHVRDRFHNRFREWWKKTIGPGDESAQAAWLDKVLELAIEAGLVENPAADPPE